MAEQRCKWNPGCTNPATGTLDDGLGPVLACDECADKELEGRQQEALSERPTAPEWWMGPEVTLDADDVAYQAEQDEALLINARRYTWGEGR